jgi:hypothetical protein
MPRGRPKGALNRKTREALHAVKESQLDDDGLSYPVRYLLSIVKNPKKPEALRIRCADLAAPFVQPKLSAVDLTQQKPPQIKPEAELVAELGALLKAHPELAKLVSAGASIEPEGGNHGHS